MLCFPTSTIYGFISIALQNGKPRRQCTSALYVQHSPTATALSTSFLLNHAPNSPKLNALITRFMVIEQHEYESNRLKKSSSDWLVS